jgi:hypothetical protein
VNFGYSLSCGTHTLNSLLLVHAIRLRIIRITAERAQGAAGRADIGKVKVAVYIKVDLIAGTALFNCLRGRTQGDTIIGGKQLQAVSP